MDITLSITLQELETMKLKNLRKLVREAILEVINESGVTVSGPKGKAAVGKGTPINQAGTISQTTGLSTRDVTDIIKQAQLGEAELDEMANVGKLFQLAPDADVSTLTGQKSRIAAAMQDAGPISQANVAKELGYTKTTTKGETVGHQNPIDKNFREMIAAGIIEPAGTQIAQRFSRPTPEPGEEAEPIGKPEAEDLFIGSHSNPLAQYFDDVPNDDGEEDFNNEEEPTIAAAGTAPVSTASMSDEDYEAFMEYTKLADRLAATKSNILKMKRGRKGGVAGDISDTTGGNEISRLEDLKKTLQAQIDALISKSDYLKRRTGQAVEPTEPEIEDEDTIDEAFDREYELRKLQFYAGIIK